MKQTVFEGAPSSGTQKQLFEKELQRENLSQTLKELRTLRVALKNPDQKKLFAQQLYQNAEEDPNKFNKKERLNQKSNSIDWHIEKRLAPTNDEEHPSTIEYMNYIRKRSVHDMGFPNVIRVSSKMDKESIYSLRKQLRRCFIQHDEFKPELDSFMAQKLYKGVYKINDQEQLDKVYQPLSDFITNQGNYKKLHMQMHEKVAAINARKVEQQNMKLKMYQEYLASQSGKSPREICKQVFRQTLVQGSDPYIKRNMDFQKQLDLNDYIQSKLEDLEPSKDGSLDLIIKNVEQMMDKGFTFQKLESTIPQQTEFQKRRPSKQVSEESQKMLSIKSSLMRIREANGYSVNASPIKQVDDAPQMHDIPSSFSLQLPKLQPSQDKQSEQETQPIPKSATGNRPQQLNDIEYSDVEKENEGSKQLERTSTANFPTAQSEVDQPRKDEAPGNTQQNLQIPEAAQIIQSIKKIDLSKIKHRGQHNMQLTALTTKNPFQQGSDRHKSHLHSPSYSSVGSYSTAINSNRNHNNKTMLSTQIQFKKQANDTAITFSAHQGQFTSKNSIDKSKRLTPLPQSVNRFQQTLGSFKANEQTIATSDNSENTSLINSTAREQFSSRRRANSVLKPIKIFTEQQNNLKTVLADCLESINTSKADINQKIIDEQFSQHNNQIDDTYQSLLFYEHQLLLHIDQPCPVVNELQPLDEIQKRRLMHIQDDTDNLTGREAIKNSLSKHEKKIVYDIFMQNAQDKNRQLWKPDNTDFPPFMKAIFKKYESEQIELPE